MAKAVKYLEGLTIHKVPYNIANTSDFKTNVMGKAADNELFIITDTPTFSLKIGNVTYDGTSNVSAIDATESASGLMSAADKIKLNGIAKGATKVVVDTALSSTSTHTVQNKVIKTELDKKADKTALDGKLDKTGGTLTGNLTGKYITGTWLQTTAATDLGYTPGKVAVLDQSGWVYYRTPAEIKSDIGADAVVTTSSDGLMSAFDKSKLDGIASEATKTIIDTSLSGTSTNPVQNKVVKAGLDKKFNKTGGIIDGYVQVNGSIYGSSVSIGNYELNDDGGLGIWDTSNPAGVDPFLTSIRIGTPKNNDHATTKKYVDTGLSGKLDKSGGTITGDVTMLKFLYLYGPLYAYETILAMRDVQCLYNDNLRIRLACDSSGAAKITTDGGKSYARLKIASPTGNDEAATKKYVDNAIKAYVDSAITVAINSSY